MNNNNDDSFSSTNSSDSSFSSTNSSDSSFGSNDGVFRPADVSGSSSGSAGTGAPGSSYSTLPTPGYLREDASAWDRFTDGQRKLIVLGVMIGIGLLLALGFGLCSGCGSCSCGSVSGSDVPSDTQTVTEISSSDADTDDDDGYIETEPVSDDESSDASEETEAVGGAMSACNHQADNEAGDGSSAGSTGFLGFLFGCTSCADSCSISCNPSLTDPVYLDGSDPSRDNLSTVSDADTEEDIWPQQPDDESYLAMLRTELTAISDCIIRLNDLNSTLSQYTDAQRVRDNDSFRAIAGEIDLWCRGAQGYDTGNLAGEQALLCNELSVSLAYSLRAYTDTYPQFITGNTSGTDIVDQSEQLNNIMTNIVELFTALNTVPETDTP